MPVVELVVAPVAGPVAAPVAGPAVEPAVEPASLTRAFLRASFLMASSRDPPDTPDTPDIFRTRRTVQLGTRHPDHPQRRNSASWFLVQRRISTCSADFPHAAPNQSGIFQHAAPNFACSAEFLFFGHAAPNCNSASHVSHAAPNYSAESMQRQIL